MDFHRGPEILGPRQATALVLQWMLAHDISRGQSSAYDLWHVRPPLLRRPSREFALVLVSEVADRRPFAPRGDCPKRSPDVGLRTELPVCTDALALKNCQKRLLVRGVNRRSVPRVLHARWQRGETFRPSRRCDKQDNGRTGKPCRGHSS